jgi:hypothetical protein
MQVSGAPVRPPAGGRRDRLAGPVAEEGDVVAKFHITVHGADRAAMADIVRVHGVRVYAQTLKQSGAGFQVDGVGDDAVIGTLTQAGYRVDRHEDLDEAGRESLKEVGTGNRFAAEAAAALRDAR